MSNSLAEHPFGSSERTFPARALLAHTAHHLVELKGSIGKFVAELAGSLCHIFPQVVVLYFAIGKGRQQIHTLHNRVRLCDDNRLGRRNSHGLYKETVPVDSGIGFLEFCKRKRIVHRRNVSALFAGPSRIGKSGLDFHNVGHDALCVLTLESGILHLLYNQFFVCFAHFFVALVVEQVVVAVAQTHSTA